MKLTLSFEIADSVPDERVVGELRGAMRTALALLAHQLSDHRAIPPDQMADWAASAGLQAGIAMMYEHGRAAGDTPDKIAAGIAEHVGDIIIDLRDDDASTLTLPPAKESTRHV